MKQFDVTTLGLEDLNAAELREKTGGGMLEKIVPGGFFVGAWEWVNTHWDSIVAGFERGAEEGAALYM